MTEVVHPTKMRILLAAYGFFYRQGFARANIEAIAEAAGVTKRTLYYHFDSKDTLVAAALENQHTYVVEQFESWGLGSANSAEELSNILFAELEKWARNPCWAGSGFTRLAIELADLPGHPIKKAASQHKSLIEKQLASHLSEFDVEDAKELARQIFILIEGCMSLSLIHGGTTYFKTAADASRSLVRVSRQEHHL